MKKIIVLSSLAAIMLTGILACRNPLDNLNDFQLNLNAGPLINPSALVSFGYSDDPESKPSNIQVFVTGKDADQVYDDNGGHEFKPMPDGTFKIILSPRSNPTADKPVVIQVEVLSDDCAPLKKEIMIFEKQKMLTVKLLLDKVTNLAPGTKYQTYPANFLGKKNSDTLVFEHQNLKGVNFVFKFPKAGVKFVEKRSSVTYVQERVTVKIPVFKDSIVEIEKDSAVNATRFLNGLPLDGVPVKVRQFVKTTVMVLESKDTTVSRPVYQVIADTIPIENVTARIFSTTESSRLVHGFYDDKGEFHDKPVLFRGITRIPDIYFLSNNNRYVDVIYMGGQRGPIIESDLGASANVNLFMSGTWYNKELGMYYDASFVAKSDLVKKRSDGKYALSNNSYFNSSIFFYENFIEGCGYANVKFDTRFSDLSSFDIRYTVSCKNQFYYGYVLPFEGYNQPVRVPAITEDGEWKISVDLDHSLNRCDGKPVLYSKTSTIPDMCVYAGKEYEFLVDYNSGDFLNKYTFAPLSVSTDLICNSGSKVTLPDQIIKFRKASCQLISGNLYLMGGKGSYGLLPNEQYIFSVTSPLNGVDIEQSLTLNTNLTDVQKIIGTVTDKNGNVTDTAYIGDLTYNRTDRKFNLYVRAFNKFFRYKLTGCD